MKKKEGVGGKESAKGEAPRRKAKRKKADEEERRQRKKREREVYVMQWKFLVAVCVLLWCGYARVRAQKVNPAHSTV